MKCHSLPTKDFQESNSQNHIHFHDRPWTAATAAWKSQQYPMWRVDTEIERQICRNWVKEAPLRVQCCVLMWVWLVLTVPLAPALLFRQVILDSCLPFDLFALRSCCPALCFMLWWVMGLVVANCRLRTQIIIFFKKNI